jgi:hypothetical protein
MSWLKRDNQLKTKVLNLTQNWQRMPWRSRNHPVEASCLINTNCKQQRSTEALALNFRHQSCSILLAVLSDGDPGMKSCIVLKTLLKTTLKIKIINREIQGNKTQCIDYHLRALKSKKLSKDSINFKALRLVLQLKFRFLQLETARYQRDQDLEERRLRLVSLSIATCNQRSQLLRDLDLKLLKYLWMLK